MIKPTHCTLVSVVLQVVICCVLTQMNYLNKVGNTLVLLLVQQTMQKQEQTTVSWP